MEKTEKREEAEKGLILIILESMKLNSNLRKLWKSQCYTCNKPEKNPEIDNPYATNPIWVEKTVLL